LYIFKILGVLVLKRVRILRKGYVLVSLTVEVRDKLRELKELIGVKSLSGTIIRMYELHKGLIELS